jgi:transcriptional antiterminator
MKSENKAIKQDLLKLFKEGKNETEAFEEVEKTHGSNSTSMKVVGNYFTKFRSKGSPIANNKKPGSKSKFTEEFIINLVNENPGMSMTELAKLAGTTANTISHRLKQINSSELKVSYSNKYNQNSTKKFTDEFLINLVNENPGLNMKELARLSGTTAATISNRLKEINIGEKRVCYIDKGFKNGGKKFTDEYLIDLIVKNPGLDAYEIADLASTTQATISNRLKQINSKRSNDNKILLEKKSSKIQRKSYKSITDELLIKLINENPKLNMEEISKLADVSKQTIYLKLKKMNTECQRVSYVKKGTKNGVKKFTDEFLIDLINMNPELNSYELAKLANATQTTILYRLKQINTDGERVGYIYKDICRGQKKITDEFLINLINENPKLNMRELAKLANVAESTISRRLRKIKSDGERVNYKNKW